MKLSSLAALLALPLVMLLSGCAGQAQAYIKAHPEFTEQQKKIVLSGKIPAGDSVAGLTREDVRTVMGGDPATFDRIGDEDAWIYVQKKAAARKPGDEASTSAGSGNRSSNGFIDAPEMGPRVDIEVRTTVFFKGNRATHALITEERP